MAEQPSEAAIEAAKRKALDPLLKRPVKPYQAPRVYRFLATGLGASMWFFLMYRAKKDGPALLGWKHPWDH